MPVKDKSLHPKNHKSPFKTWRKNIFIGKPPKIVEIQSITGRINAVTRRKITIAIKEIAEKCTKFKIGATGDTLVRVDQKDYRKGYDSIQEVFRSTSEEIIKRIEVEVIKKFKEMYPDKIQNKSVARAGRLTSYDGNFYLYVVYS